MKTDLDIYTVASRYLEDEKDHLSVSDKQFLAGSIRSRCLPNLADPWRGVGPEHRGVQEARVLAQLSAFFKKNASFESAECFDNTKANFERAEKLCRITNRRLDHYGLHEERLPGFRLAEIMRMRKFISRVLGPVSRLMSVLPHHLRVTSGASESATRDKSVPYMKMCKKIRCTSGAVPFVRALCRYHTGRDVECIVSDVNRIVNVKKDWKVFRSIAAEPMGNLPIQLAIDAYLKDRLRKTVGIDLTDQTRNAKAAYLGSLGFGLATIDLTMASDTLAFNVIPFLFPYEWFEILNRLRASRYRGPFGSGVYSKFSSMGNGFTFSVETLLFAAACNAVGSKEYLVYGDDIVIESHLYSKVVSLLSFLGFKVNPSKSFSEGPFRESCGSDFHSGINIRPFFIKEKAKNVMDLSHQINGLISISRPDGKLWSYLKQIVVSNGMLLVPYSEESRAGIFVSTRAARSLGNVRVRNWIHECRCYRERKRNRLVAGLRSLLLWHFIKITHEAELEVSLVPTSSNKVGRAWTRLSDGSSAPIHIDLWTAYLLG